MNETVACPNCRADLVLPVLPLGQTVQCPRCQHVFEPAHRRAQPTHAAPVVRRRTPDDEPIDDSPPPFRPLTSEWKAIAAMAFLGASLLSYGLQLYTVYEKENLSRDLMIEQGFRRERLDRRIQLGQFQRQSRFVENLSSFAMGVHHLTYWPCVVVFLIWFHQAVSNVRILRASGTFFSPVKAVFAFFIPFANVVMPYQIMQETWRASDPNLVKDPRSWQQSTGSWLIWSWWITLIAAAVLRIWNAVTSRGDRMESDSFTLSGGSNVCMIAAGVMLIVIIYQIRQRQRARHAKIYDEAA